MATIAARKGHEVIILARDPVQVRFLKKNLNY